MGVTVPVRNKKNAGLLLGIYRLPTKPQPLTRSDHLPRLFRTAIQRTKLPLATNAAVIYRGKFTVIRGKIWSKKPTACVGCSRAHLELRTRKVL